jgi:ankyrin repeat protein
MERNLEERVDMHFRDSGVASLDCVGMMRHILDSLGALRIRSKSVEVPMHVRRTFNYAVLKFMEEIVDKDHEDTSAVGYLMDVFPDERKRGDGRNWLPLHWAAATESTTEADFTSTVREHPAVTNYDHSKSVQDIEKPSNDKKSMYSVGEYTVINTDGLLPLHLLVAQRRPALTNVLTLLGSNKFTVAVADGRGWLPIHWCASNCVDVDISRLLVDEYLHSLAVTTTRGQLPFQLAARNRNVDVLRYLYHMHPDALQSIDLDGNSALHDAATYFNPGSAAALLNIKPDMGLSKNFLDQLPVHCLFRIIPNHKRIRQRQLETLRVVRSVSAYLMLCESHCLSLRPVLGASSNDCNIQG